MSSAAALQPPPFCPNPKCDFHRAPTTCWRWVRYGFFQRQGEPHRIQRFRCGHCGRHFSEQTFRTSYWLKRPELLPRVFWAQVQCVGHRQLARELEVSPQTIALQAARLGRHCQLFHEQLRPKRLPEEPLDLDGLQSFEYSQYYPTLFHTLVGQGSHFFHGFTDSELRRSGRMTPQQKRRRAALEARLGRPDPRSSEREVAKLLGIVAAGAGRIVLWSDEHQDYPRAIRALPQLEVEHRTISSRAARTPRNPLFAINLVDMLVRHSAAAHKRQTIAFAKRRQAAVERMWVFLVWRNYIKWFSENQRKWTPAMRAGVCTRPLKVQDVLKERLFPSRIELPERWSTYYWRLTPTRAFPRIRIHNCKYAA